MLKKDSALSHSLKEMLKLCRDLQSLLLNDKKHFGENNLPMIGESNAKKEKLLAQINHLMNELGSQSKADPSVDFLKSLELNAENLDANTKQEVRSIGQELKTEISQCYQSLVTNNAIIYSGLQDVKNLWDRLVANKNDGNLVYDHKGSKIK